MGNRNRARSGKGILIAVVLGPLCAAAADLPGRATATPADSNLPIQVFEHARVAPEGLAPLAKASAVRKQQSQHRSPVVNLAALPWLDPGDGLISRPTTIADPSVRRYWLENPTSTGP